MSYFSKKFDDFEKGKYRFSKFRKIRKDCCQSRDVHAREPSFQDLGCAIWLWSNTERCWAQQVENKVSFEPYIQPYTFIMALKKRLDRMEADVTYPLRISTVHATRFRATCFAPQGWLRGEGRKGEERNL